MYMNSNKKNKLDLLLVKANELLKFNSEQEKLELETGKSYGMSLTGNS